MFTKIVLSCINSKALNRTLFTVNKALVIHLRKVVDILHISVGKHVSYTCSRGKIPRISIEEITPV